MTSLAQQLGIDSSDYSLLGTDTTTFLGDSRFHTFTQGLPVRYKALLGTAEIEAATTLLQSYLTRLTLIKRTAAGGGDYWMINGTLRSVKLANSVNIGGQEYSLAELFTHIVNDSIEDSSKHVSVDRFCELVGRYGFDIDNRSNGMGLNFMHFGADLDKVNAIFEWFAGEGATDQMHTISNPNGIERVLGFDRDQRGVEIVEFRQGTMDRSLTQNNQGFVSFVDAAYGNFDRFVKNRAKARVMEAELKAKLDKGNVSEANAATARALIKEMKDASSAWMGTWGGVSQRMTTAPSGESVATLIYDTVKVPIGTLKTSTGHVIDFWKNSNADASSAATSTVAVDMTEDEPF